MLSIFLQEFSTVQVMARRCVFRIFARFDIDGKNRQIESVLRKPAKTKDFKTNSAECTHRSAESLSAKAEKRTCLIPTHLEIEKQPTGVLKTI